MDADSNILIPRAKEARMVLPDALRSIGAKVDVVQCYKTIAADCDYSDVIGKLENKEIDVVTFTSSSTVTNLLSLLNGRKDLLNGVVKACIGPITAKTCEQNDIKPDITAKVYTIKGMTDAIRDFYSA